MTTNFEKFVEFNGVLQDWKTKRDEKDAEQVKSITITRTVTKRAAITKGIIITMTETMAI